MAGNLYQLRTSALPGQNVIIDGPYDRYGIVIKHRESGYHLIRGTGMNQPSGSGPLARALTG
jgi:hypothetical protein